jgi:hypothetical protein
MYKYSQENFKYMGKLKKYEEIYLIIEKIMLENFTWEIRYISVDVDWSAETCLEIIPKKSGMFLLIDQRKYALKLYLRN